MLSKEIKAKIFSLYPNCKVVFTDREYDGNEVIYEQEMTGTVIQVDFETLKICAKVQFGEEVKHYEYYEIDDMAYLLLRSVKQLTDEEYRMVANINFPQGKLANDFYVNQGKILIKENRINLRIGDYLRSIGIALPFTTVVDGAVRTIGAEGMVEEKIIQIQE